MLRALSASGNKRCRLGISVAPLRVWSLRDDVTVRVCLFVISVLIPQSVDMRPRWTIDPVFPTLHQRGVPEFESGSIPTWWRSHLVCLFVRRPWKVVVNVSQPLIVWAACGYGKHMMGSSFLLWLWKEKESREVKAWQLFDFAGMTVSHTEWFSFFCLFFFCSTPAKFDIPTRIFHCLLIVLSYNNNYNLIITQKAHSPVTSSLTLRLSKNKSFKSIHGHFIH